MPTVELVEIQHTLTGNRAVVAPDSISAWVPLGWKVLGPALPPVTFDPRVDTINDRQTVRWNATLGRFQAADLPDLTGTSAMQALDLGIAVPTPHLWWKADRAAARGSAAVIQPGDIVTFNDGTPPLFGTGALTLAQLVAATETPPEAATPDVDYDSAGNVIRRVNPNGSFEYADLRHQPGSVPLAALAADATALLPFVIPVESGYSETEEDSQGNIISGTTFPEGQKVSVWSAAVTGVTVAQLAPEVVARLVPSPATHDLLETTGNAPNRRLWLCRDVPWADRVAITDGTSDATDGILTPDRGVLFTSAGTRFWCPAPHGNVYRATPTPMIVVRYGDSLTAGKDKIDQGIEATLSGVQSINQGIPGQASTDIAMRQGGTVVSYTVAGGVIPADTSSVAVTPVSSTSGALEFSSAGPFTFTGVFAGVAGTMTHALGVNGQQTQNWTFARTTPGAAVPVVGAKPFTCTTALGAPSGHSQAACGAVDEQRIQILGLGRNNTQLTTLPAVANDIAACVRFLKPYNRRFIVLGVANRLDEIPGTAQYAAIIALNAQLAATYGAAFFDLRTYLVKYALENMGLTPTADDLADRGNDTVPRQLHDQTAGVDPLHWSEDTYFHVGVVLANLMSSVGVPQMGLPGKGYF